MFCFLYLDNVFKKKKAYDLFQEKLRNLMSLDGESLFTIVKCIHLLVLPRIVFIELNDHFSKIKVGAVLGFNCCITVILSILKRERGRIS